MDLANSFKAALCAILVLSSGCSGAPSRKAGSSNDYLREQNGKTQLILLNEQETVKRLIDRIASFKLRSSKGFTIGPYRYFSRYDEALPFPLLYRSSNEGSEQLVLDLNSIATAYRNAIPGEIRISPLQNYVAFTIQSAPGDEPRLFVTEISSLTWREVASGVTEVEWGVDESTLFIVANGENSRPQLLLSASNPYRKGPEFNLLKREENPGRFLRIERANSGEYLFLYSEGNGQVVPSFLPLAAVPLTVHSASAPLVRARMGHSAGKIWLFSTDRHGISLLSYRGKDREWSKYEQYSSDTVLEGLEAARSHLVLFLREGAASRIRVIKQDLEAVVRGVPGPLATVRPYPNPDHNGELINFKLSAPDRFESVCALSLTDLGLHGCGKDAESDISLRLIETESSDGASIPLSITSSKSASIIGVDLRVYAAYGEDLSWSLSPLDKALMEEGVAIARCHARGGGYHGYKWHQAGRAQGKHRSQSDLLACGKRLRELGFDKIALSARSAGAVTAAAVYADHPELFSAAVFDVPFLDVIESMKREELLLTPREYAEWGDPRDPDELAYMKLYAPLEKLSPKNYPPAMVTVSLLDRRTPYREGARWVEKVRALQKGAAPILLWTDLEGDHGGAATRNRADYISAMRYAFMLAAFGDRLNGSQSTSES